MPLVKASDGRAVVPIWVNGAARDTDETRLFEVVSSALNGKVVHHAQGAVKADAVAAVEAAAAALPQWRQTSHIARRDLLLKVATIYEAKADKLTQYQVDETSCTEQFARFNIKLACKMLREFAGQITEALTGVVPPVPAGSMGFVFKEAIGVVLIIPPWNSSIILSTRGVAAAIAAGCTVVVKSSELCPRTHHFVVEAFEESGLPAGAMNSLQAVRGEAAAVTEALIAHPAVRKVEFVGSAGVGRIVGQVAAKYLKPVLMELGGKGPAIVLKDANLENAARLCALGAFIHHGQICFSTERIIVEKAVAEDFTKLLRNEVESRHSDGAGHAVQASAAEKARVMIDEAVQGGASFVVGANKLRDETKAALQPTIITGVKPSDRIYDQETFGPSATLYVVDDQDAAIELANSSSYGLNAAVHSRDTYKALQIARRLEYGQVHINSPTTYDEETMPIQGIKASGWGSNNGKYGIGEYLVSKSVTVRDAEATKSAFGT